MQQTLYIFLPVALFVKFSLFETGAAEMVNPADIAKLGSTSLILGCHLKTMERIGHGTSNSNILKSKNIKRNYYLSLVQQQVNLEWSIRDIIIILTVTLQWWLQSRVLKV